MIGIGTSFMNRTNGFVHTSYKESDYKETNIVLSPAIGYLLFENFAIGSNLLFTYYKITTESYIYDMKTLSTESVKTSNSAFGIGASPFARYYFATQMVKPYIYANGIVNKFNPTENKGTASILSTGYGGGAGIAIPLGEIVSFDVSAGFVRLQQTQKIKTEYADTEQKNTSNNFVMELGFSMFF
jgi:hypothetical protein